MEGLRLIPKAPVTLGWAPEIPINYVEVGGTKLRYIKSGSGPVVVLLHTLRTQLDLFEKVVPELSKRCTVYALDYPGHGFSDIPNARYDAEFFTKAVEGFLDKLDLRAVTLVGVSIGGVIPLIIAARHNPRVTRVIAINPYDYAKGRGMARSSILGWMITYAALVPVLGETVMRLRNFVIMKAVLRGGVADPKSIPPALMNEMYAVGNRRGTTAPSSVCSATAKVGKPRQTTTAASLCRSCSSGATRTGRDRPSASAPARSSLVHRWRPSQTGGISCRSIGRVRCSN